MTISYSTDSRSAKRTGRFWTLSIAAVFALALVASDSTPGRAADAQPGDEVAVAAAGDGLVRSIVPDARNLTGYAGLSATIGRAATDHAMISPDGRTFTLVAQDGTVLLTSSDPQIGVGSRIVDARFILQGDKLIVSPLALGVLSRSACASSFWGNLIFNVGMTGVCSALTIGTVVGGVVCTAALIGANTAINWDSQC
jgi:hypothetical protein